MTPYGRLLELRKYLEAEIDIETARPNYIGAQRALTYSRVLRRLTPIIRQAAKVRRQFDFVELASTVHPQPGPASAQPHLAKSSPESGCSSGLPETNKD